jgi:hypothetical protein
MVVSLPCSCKLLNKASTNLLDLCFSMATTHFVGGAKIEIYSKDCSLKYPVLRTLREAHAQTDGLNYLGLCGVLYVGAVTPRVSCKCRPGISVSTQTVHRRILYAVPREPWLPTRTEPLHCIRNASGCPFTGGNQAFTKPCP